MRKCEVKMVKETYHGYFHGWGLIDVGTETNCPATVAVVEREDGRISLIEPQYVTFLDRLVVDGKAEN